MKKFLIFVIFFSFCILSCKEKSNDVLKISDGTKEFKVSPGSSSDLKVEAAIKQILFFKIALDRYSLDNGFYPTTEQGIDALYNKTTKKPIPKNYPHSGYIKQAKIPDPWGNNFIYKFIDKDKGYFEIMSYGADNKKGGSGADTDIVGSFE